MKSQKILLNNNSISNKIKPNPFQDNLREWICDAH